VRRAAIVTGSDSGIGRATAVALAAHGLDVGVTWHSDEVGARETARRVSEQGGRAALARLDLTSAPQTAIDELAAALGRLDVLVNNAGANHRSTVLEDDLEGWRRALEVNLTGAFACAQAAARIMVAAGRGGRIVNVTSIHEHVPLAGAGAYCAAKAGLGMLTQVLALELAPHAITVNAVAPGHIATPMTGKAGLDPHAIALPPVPLGRPGAPEEVAALIALLAAEEASYVTGASVLVDGGLRLTAVEPLRTLVEGPRG
jgi:hypothetical protein